MKSFKQIISEVAQPKDKGAHEEQAFKDQHTYEVKPHPVALDTQFTGDIQKPQAMRKADQKGDANYDKAYSKGIFEEEANLQENPAEEIPMMEKQLDFISQAVSEIKDSLGNGDPKEWYQNKLTAAYEAVKTLHANLQTEALSPKQKELDTDKDGDIDGKDLAALRARKKKKNEDLEEAQAHSDKHVKMAIGIASDKRYKGGNYDGAVKAMNKMKPGISDHPQVAAVLKRQNEEALAEDMNKVHTVDIDHIGGADSNAKKHNITLKKSKHTADSHSATGKKKDLHKYLAKHYDSHDDAKELHPELHEDMNKVHTVDIDHDGSKDANAKKHNITLKKTGDYSHDATGKKKDLHKYLAKHYDSHDDAKELHPELHETTMSATKKPVTMTGPDGKTRTVMKTTKVKRTDDHGQEIIKTNESIIKELEENIKFKVGMMKLKNGKSVVLKKQDADLLTQMFKDLSANNRRKLGQVAMKDEAGFKEILGFAREAL